MNSFNGLKIVCSKFKLKNVDRFNKFTKDGVRTTQNWMQTCRWISKNKFPYCNYMQLLILVLESGRHEIRARITFFLEYFSSEEIYPKGEIQPKYMSGVLEKVLQLGKKLQEIDKANILSCCTKTSGRARFSIFLACGWLASR